MSRTRRLDELVYVLAAAISDGFRRKDRAQVHLDCTDALSRLVDVAAERAAELAGRRLSEHAKATEPAPIRIRPDPRTDAGLLHSFCCRLCDALEEQAAECSGPAPTDSELEAGTWAASSVVKASAAVVRQLAAIFGFQALEAWTDRAGVELAFSSAREIAELEEPPDPDDRAPCKRCGEPVADGEYDDNRGFHTGCVPDEGDWRDA